MVDLGAVFRPDFVVLASIILSVDFHSVRRLVMIASGLLQYLMWFLKAPWYLMGTSSLQ